MGEGTRLSNGSSSVERRLATILIADVYDYSRLMGEDEERTVRTMRGHRAVFDQLLKAHRGRSFNTAGDATLAEFPSAVEAVRCATEIQTALHTRNGQLPVAQRMWFRIGVNLGDVIVQEGDLLGDGVNVAARIQSIAEPGGVCISGSVYDQIQTKLTLPIRSLGEQSFKNIALPIRVFSIRVDDGAPRPLALRWRVARKAPFAAAAGIVALIAVGVTGVWMYRDYGARVAQDARQANASQRAAESRLKAEQEQMAATEAKKEAALQAQLQSAKDALAKAEATKLKAEQERSTAEPAQRQAKLQDEVKSTRDGVQKAQQREKSAEDAVKAASAAAQSATAAVPKALEPPATADVGASRQPAATQAAMSASPAPPSPVVDAKSADRFDGVYAGQMCAPHVDNTLRCWDVVLKAKHGALSAAWPSPWSTQLARASGTISPEGNVELLLAGFNASSGRPNPGNMTGRWSGNTITASGSWTRGGPVSAVWKWAPGASMPTESAEDAVKAASAAAQSATAAVPKAPAAPAPADVGASRQPAATQAAMSANPAPPGLAADARSVDRFDGTYAGEMCSPHIDNTMRCWDVVLKVQHGTLSSAWPSAFSAKLARANGTISPEGTVELSLAATKISNGQPLSGKMTGSWAGNTITVAGSWASGNPISAVWKWAPGASMPTESAQATATDNATDDDAQGSRTGGGRHRRR